jgi:hypothetical protein
MWLRFITVSVLLSLSACSTPQPAPSLNLSYTPAVRSTRGNSITVALVKPLFTGTQQVNDNSDKEPGPPDAIAQIYNNNYSQRLQNALLASIENILSARGFIINLSFGTFDQIPLTDKQKIDLIVLTTFDLGPLVTNNQTIYQYPTGTRLVTNVGTVELIGTLTVEFVDPLSKTKVMTKTVDVTSLSSNAPVEYNDQTEAGDKFIELLNRIYPRLMARVEKEINTNDLQEALKNFKRLKEKRP